MTFAFGNLLVRASSIIPQSGTAVKYQSYIGENINEMGVPVPVYADPVEARPAHIHPLSAEMYEKFGFQIGKNYVIVYLPANIAGVAQKSISDKVIYNGKTFTIVNSFSWYVYSGFNKVIAVEDKD